MTNGAGLDTDSTCGSRTWATLFSFEQLILISKGEKNETE